MSIERRQSELDQLHEAANYALEHCEQIHAAAGLEEYRREVHLWHYVSLHTHTSWTLFSSRQAGGPDATALVRRVVWDARLDAERLMTGSRQESPARPTLVVKDRLVPRAELTQRLAILRAVVIAPFAPPRTTMNGESRGITTGLGQVSLEWWGNGPREYWPLVVWHDGVCKWLEHALNVPPKEPGVDTLLRSLSREHRA